MPSVFQKFHKKTLFMITYNRLSPFIWQSNDPQRTDPSVLLLSNTITVQSMLWYVDLVRMRTSSTLGISEIAANEGFTWCKMDWDPKLMYSQHRWIACVVWWLMLSSFRFPCSYNKYLQGVHIFLSKLALEKRGGPLTVLHSQNGMEVTIVCHPNIPATTSWRMSSLFTFNWGFHPCDTVVQSWVLLIDISPVTSKGVNTLKSRLCANSEEHVSLECVKRPQLQLSIIRLRAYSYETPRGVQNKEKNTPKCLRAIPSIVPEKA